MSEQELANWLQDRWTLAPGRDRARVVREWLLGQGPMPDGIGMHEGRVDLRGFPLGLGTTTVGDPRQPDGPAWEGLDLSYADLSDAFLHAVTMRNCRFDRATCLSWRCHGVRVEGCSFVGAQMSRSLLSVATAESGTHQRRSVWRDVDFTGARLRDASWRDANIIECTFHHLHSVWMTGCPVVSGTWSGRVRKVTVSGPAGAPGGFSVSMAGVTDMSDVAVTGMQLDLDRLQCAVPGVFTVQDALRNLDRASDAGILPDGSGPAVEFVRRLLRHAPEAGDLLLCPSGWADTEGEERLRAVLACLG